VTPAHQAWESEVFNVKTGVRRRETALCSTSEKWIHARENPDGVEKKGRHLKQERREGRIRSITPNAAIKANSPL